MEKALNGIDESLNMNHGIDEFKNNWNILCVEHLKERQKKLNDQLEKVKIVWKEYISDNLNHESLTYSQHLPNHPSSDKVIE